jgi:hypothetical protein
VADIGATQAATRLPLIGAAAYDRAWRLQVGAVPAQAITLGR